MASSRTGSRPYLPNSPYNAARAAAAAAVDPLAVGVQVCHERHGLGRVVALEGNQSAIIDFGSKNVVRVRLDSPRLERL